MAARLLTALMVVLLLASTSARAAGDLPNTPPNGWWWYYGESVDQVNALVAANKARLTGVQVEQVSPLRFTVTMVANTGAYAKTWWWYYGQSEADLNNLVKQHHARIVSLDAYPVGGKISFSAVFISNTGADARGWWWYYGENPASVGNHVAEHKARLIDFRQYSVGTATRYTAVMVDNTGADAIGWWWYYNVTPAQLESDLRKNGAYPVSLQVARIGAPTFNVVMDKLPTPGGRGWWWYYGESAPVLTELYERNIAWLRDVKTYQSDGRRVFTALMLGFPPRPEAVTTYHYDNNRTGWNNRELALKPSSVASSRFDLRRTVALDDQVDAQPLVVPGLASVGGRTTSGHDVAYVATESNTVYAIDAATGAILAQRNLGPPVPTPLNCGNNGPNVGVNGTPVIDLAARTIYLVTYGIEAGAPVHRIHALDLATLADRVPPPKVTASHTLSNGATVTFDPRRQRQRAGLLAANGNIYAGFASYCDFQAGNSRGWILGWHANTLAPLPANHLSNQLASAPHNFFLTSIWMSGYGLAADRSGFVYAVTGNSDQSGTTYNVTRNLSESVVKLKPDLTDVVDFFTPSNVGPLDQGDTDYGSGGVMTVLPQNGAVPNLLAAAGKDGRLFVLNADHMGGFTSGGPDKDLTLQNIGGCWCGQSYFMEPHGVLVSSGGASATLWDVHTSPVALADAGSTQPISNSAKINDPGFFTTVSSFATGPGVVIWAVSRPDNQANPEVFLNAFSETKDASGHLTLLRRLPAGTWPNTGGNANIVPVVANGRVFVATDRRLAIFGLQ